MENDDSEHDGCVLCGVDVGSTSGQSESGQKFCSAGCRDVYATLGEGEPRQTPGKSTNETLEDAQNETKPAEQAVRSFFRIDGMYSASCEAFLESITEPREGVVDADASYVTETIRITHDPDRISDSELRDELSTLGYTAYLREDAATESTGSASTTRQSREMDGIRKRRDDQMLDMRYAAGLLFGAFLMVPYVAVLYPAHLATLVDWESFQIFEGAFQLDSQGAFVFLRLYFVLTGIIIFFTGLPVLRGAYISLKMRQPNTDLLVAITAISAYVYSTVAILLGRNDIFFDLAIVVAAAVTAAMFYESSVKQRALERLTELTVSQVDTARIYTADEATDEVDVENLTSDDLVLVREGERVPVDGELVDSGCSVDEGIVTGESLPVWKQPGDEVIGGSIVTDGAALIQVDEGATSSIDRITTAVWDLQSATHSVQRHANRLASRAIVLVGGVAIVGTTAALVSGSSASGSFLLFLAILITTSPWMLGFATPISVASSLEEALSRGIVVFDETVFERLREVDTVVFDKTGTLTTGEMDVIEADAPPELLADAAALERRASHPAANAMVAAFARETDSSGSASSADEVNSEPEESLPVRTTEFTTHRTGVEGVVDETKLLVGNLDLFEEKGWEVRDALESHALEARGFGRLPVIVGRDGAAEGIIVVGDEPRDGWNQTVRRLGERGTEVVVLTGDDEEATDFFRQHEDVTHVFAGVSPEGKTATIRRLKSDGQVAMVGDGTNDAPALAAADLGISLGGGTALAADAADITIVDNDIGAVETAFDLASAASRRVKQNNILALLYNGIAVLTLAIGIFNPLTAAIAVSASGGLIAANSQRELIDS